MDEHYETNLLCSTYIMFYITEANLDPCQLVLHKLMECWMLVWQLGLFTLYSKSFPSFKGFEILMFKVRYNDKYVVVRWLLIELREERCVPNYMKKRY